MLIYFVCANGTATCENDQLCNGYHIVQRQSECMNSKIAMKALLAVPHLRDIAGAK